MLIHFHQVQKITQRLFSYRIITVISHPHSSVAFITSAAMCKHSAVQQKVIVSFSASINIASTSRANLCWRLQLLSRSLEWDANFYAQ
ncbi:hypothetical protein TNCV_1047161 [Trichonephila clavipes]|nr:hypothetical protein TNCV_1047161 [Trichonephila clavipes]